MSRTGRSVVFGGSLMVILAQAPVVQAQSFGQQWRPAADYPSVSVRPAQRRVASSVANVPSFRPPTEQFGRVGASASSARYAGATQPAVAQASVRHAMPRYQPIPGYPSYAAYQRIPTYAPPRYAAPVAGGMPPWANPMTQMARMWQNPMPMFAPQYAWQPAEQPWQARGIPAYDAHPYRGPALQPRFGYMPAPYGAMPRSQSHGDNWRSASRVQSTQRYSASPRTIASYRSTASPSRSVAPRGGWRPDRGAVADGPSFAFRPVDYGRGTRVDTLAQPRPAADLLPGWATTYRDQGGALSCHWCGES